MTGSRIHVLNCHASVGWHPALINKEIILLYWTPACAGVTIFPRPRGQSTGRRNVIHAS